MDIANWLDAQLECSLTDQEANWEVRAWSKGTTILGLCSTDNGPWLLFVIGLAVLLSIFLFSTWHGLLSGGAFISFYFIYLFWVNLSGGA